MKSMSFTLFSTVLLIQPNPTQPMDGPNPCPSLAETLLLILLFTVAGDMARGVRMNKKIWPFVISSSRSRQIYHRCLPLLGLVYISQFYLLGIW